MEDPSAQPPPQVDNINMISTSIIVSNQDQDQSDQYDSADGSYSDDDDDDDGGENNETKVTSRGDDHRGSGSDTEEGSVILERESGDGQEESIMPSGRKVDDDEDKKNPQYIPKKGTFYEHDDRTADDNNIETTITTIVEEPDKTITDKDGKVKKVWQDKKEKWGHDKFNDGDQAPKSRAELISIYGYDIRNEDGPPRARRRRRYGRGPNKYTRNWEDEDAYNNKSSAPIMTGNNNIGKTRQFQRDRKSGGGGSRGHVEEFPPLGGGDLDTAHSVVVVNAKEEYEEEQKHNHNIQSSNRFNKQQEQSNNYESINRKNQDVVKGQNAVQCPTTSAHIIVNTNNNKSYQEQQQQRVGSGRVIKPKAKEIIKDSDFKGFTTKTRQVRNVGQNQMKNSSSDYIIQSQNYTNRNNNVVLQDLDKDMSKLNVTGQDSNIIIHKGSGNKHHNGNNSRQGSVPPRLQSSEQQKGSKRYSSIRQRSLPETATPPFNQHANYYANEYNQQNHQVGPGPQPGHVIHHPSATAQIAPPPLSAIPPVPVPTAPILPFPQPPPPFLQPGVAPPPFMPQQAPPPLLNYIPNQAQFSPAYQGYQQQFNSVVTQPGELYQPQGGITYYSADQQIIQQRVVPQKRPKAAIPIVAPPPPPPPNKEDGMSAGVDIPGIVEQDNVEKSNLIKGAAESGGVALSEQQE